MGTLGPFVQGSSRSLTLRFKVATLFGGAFIAGSTAVFALAFLLGAVSRVSDLPVAWLQSIAVVGLVVLASTDVVARKKASYCPIGWRRQTPKTLMHRHSVTRVAAVWGLDTGLVFTTFRVAAMTWGAFLFAFLGLSKWWIGIGYGVGFVIPLMVLLWTHRVGRSSASKTPSDPGLETLLGKRAAAQLASAVLLTTGGAILLAELLV